MSWSDDSQLFEAVSTPPEGCDGASYFIFHREQILQPSDASSWKPLTSEEWGAAEWDLESLHCIGVRGSEALFAADLRTVHEAHEFTGLRNIFGVAESIHFALAGRATQIIAWHKTHQFCGRCGAPTSGAEKEHAKVCSACRLSFYPRLSPSIIVLVTRGKELLLARNVRWPEGRYSTLAGFVEPGESIEEALHREVREEVGIEVSNLRYMGSQSWPFPNSLMIGFHADYHSGELLLQREEIADARWFAPGDLPAIPGKTAISRWLIDAFVESAEH